jgi:hypothetical protein
LGIGIGVGVNYNPFHHKFFGIKSVPVESKDLMKLYLSVYYYLKSPQLPVKPTGTAFFFGTNLFPASISDDVIFGLRFGAKGGLMLGANYMLRDGVRRVNAFAGFDYKL